MAITSDRVRNASDHLDEVTKSLLITWFRESDIYRANAAVYSSDIVSRIDAAEGTIKARIINAVVKEIDDLGVGEVEIRGDRDAVWWNQSKERQALLQTAFLVLYDDLVEGDTGTGTGVIESMGISGDAAVGQRPQYTGIFGQYVRPCCGYYPNCDCYIVGRVRSYPY